MSACRADARFFRHAANFEKSIGIKTGFHSLPPQKRDQHAVPQPVVRSKYLTCTRNQEFSLRKRYDHILVLMFCIFKQRFFAAYAKTIPVAATVRPSCCRVRFCKGKGAAPCPKASVAIRCFRSNGTGGTQVVSSLTPEISSTPASAGRSRWSGAWLDSRLPMTTPGIDPTSSAPSSPKSTSP